MTALTDPAQIELAMLEADLNAAIRNADPERILNCATALDRLSRGLAPHQELIARRAQSVVAGAITALEIVLNRSRHEPRQTRKMRAAYGGQAS